MESKTTHSTNFFNIFGRKFHSKRIGNSTALCLNFLVSFFTKLSLSTTNSTERLNHLSSTDVPSKEVSVSFFDALFNWLNPFNSLSAKGLMPIVLVVSLLLGNMVWGQVSITVSSNTNWSALDRDVVAAGIQPPNANDVIIVNNDAVLTVDVNNGECKSIGLGLNTNNKEGTLTFNLNSQITVSGVVTFDGSNQTQKIIMTNGGKLICQGFSGTNITFTPGSGTVELAANNTLPSSNLTNFNNLIISSGTTTLGVAISVSANVSINEGAILDVSSRQMTLGSGSYLTVNGTLDFSASAGLIRTGNNVNATITMGPNGLIKTADDSGLGPLLNASLQNQGTGTWDTMSINSIGKVEYYRSSAQSVTNRTYNNLIITNPGTKTFSGIITINGNLSINTSAVVNLETFTSMANSLTLGGVGQVNGSWGSTSGSCPAINKNSTYFGTTATGILNVTTNTSPCTAPSITSQPANSTITYGENSSFTVVASNATGYQWEVSINGGGTWSTITNGGVYANATTSTINITKPTVAMNTYQYRCVVTGACTPVATSIGASLTVNPKAITVSANAGQGKVYGAIDPIITYTPSESLLAGNNFSGTLARTAGETVAGGPYAYNIGTLSAGSNYNVTFTGSNTFTINTLSVSVTADAKSKTYGDLDPALTFVSSPAVGNTLANGETISFTGALSRAAGETVVGSPYAIGQNTVANSNYAITYNGADLTITERPITITADAKTKVYGTLDPVLTYQITSGSLAFSDSFTGSLTREVGETVGGSPYAIQQNTVALNSNYILSYIGANLTITTAPVTSSVTASPTSVQYSDQATFTVTIEGGAPLVIDGPQAAISATFNIGTQEMGTANFEVNGSDIVATATYALLEGVVGQMAPEIKTVTAVINNQDTNFNISPSSPTTSLTITQENAWVDYTGDVMKATANASTRFATVTLRANIFDISVPQTPADPAYDVYSGDIRNAKVMFVDRDNSNAPISGWIPVSILINPADTKVGTVSFPYLVNLPSNEDFRFITVGIIVDNGYYIRNSAGDNSVVTVYLPVGDFITGGGYILPTQSVGTMASTPGKKVNFGFNVKFNKTGKNLKGNMNIIFRRLESDGIVHSYQIKANAMQSLGVNASNPASQTAEYVSKTNLTDITNPLSPISMGGNNYLHVKMTDNGEPGLNDMISFVLVNGTVDPTIPGNIIFSSNWVAFKTEQMNLAGGNLKVHSGFSLGTTATSSTKTANNTSIKAAQPLEMDTEPLLFNATAYPNPSADYFTLNLQGMSYEASQKVEVNVFDVLGRQVYRAQGSSQDSYEFGQNFQVGVYLVTVKQGSNTASLKVIKK